MTGLPLSSFRVTVLPGADGSAKSGARVPAASIVMLEKIYRGPPNVRCKLSRRATIIRTHQHATGTMPSSKAPASGTLSDLSTQLAAAVERASSSIVAIHARRRIPSSGIVWRDDVIVSASHTVRLDDDIKVTLPDGATAQATIAGRDPSTDVIAL